MKVTGFISLILMGVMLSACSTGNWRTASRESTGLAPKAEELREAIFQIYTARAFGWRRYFGVHPWIAWKKKEDDQYTVAHVVSWNLRRGASALEVKKDLPDRRWFDQQPKLIFSVNGERAERIIEQVRKLIENYPYKESYRLWPGPNSNTFVEYIIRNVSDLTVELPPHAVGKDYLADGQVLAASPSGTGFQVSFFGALGFTVGLAEGMELNLLGMTFGLDVLRPALKLPFVGRIGMEDRPLAPAED